MEKLPDEERIVFHVCAVVAMLAIISNPENRCPCGELGHQAYEAAESMMDEARNRGLFDK